MKKLMIAAAIVCAAALSHGAIIQWNVTNIYNEPGTALIPNTGTGAYSIYLFTTTAVALDSWNADNFASNIAKGYEMGLTDAGKSQNTGNSVTDTVVNENSALNLVAGTTYSFYAVAVNNDESAYYISSTANALVSGGATDIASAAFGNQRQRTQSGGTSYVGWQSVPEPTSGLLLLLGVAGLALRRRRA